MANALTASRLDNPAGKVKEALSNALWSITSIPEVALYVTQNFDFLQVIIDTIKQGPDSDSETHTGNFGLNPAQIPTPECFQLYFQLYIKAFWRIACPNDMLILVYSSLLFKHCSSY